MIEKVSLAGDGSLAVPGFVSKLYRAPGNLRRNAPAIGQDTDAVLREIGLDESKIAESKRRGVLNQF